MGYSDYRVTTIFFRARVESVDKVDRMRRTEHRELKGDPVVTESHMSHVMYSI